jgi:hypothetical protein
MNIAMKVSRVIHSTAGRRRISRYPPALDSSSEGSDWVRTCRRGPSSSAIGMRLVAASMRKIIVNVSGE